MFSSLFFASEIPTSVLLIGTLFTGWDSVGAGSSSYYEPVAGLISRSAGAAPCSSWLLRSALGTVICALDRCTLFLLREYLWSGGGQCRSFRTAET